MSKGAAEFFEGNWPAAGFQVAGGTFGLIDYAVGNGGTPTAQLTQMDADLDTLIVNVNAIADQLTGLNNQINGLTYYIQNANDMGSTTLKDAEAWLTDYYLDQTQTLQSRNWARWYMAGCPIVASNPSLPPGCPSESNPVTTANFNAFKADYVQNPGHTTAASDDFPLWWAASVIGNVLNGVEAYAGVGGTTADGFATLIHQGLTENPGTDSNSLLAYMRWIFTSYSSCVNDVSAPGCDLYSQVYVPTEAFFLQAIGDQTQLAAAITEADGVLAERFPGTYQSRANDDMARMNQYVNEEVEVFLEVAEQIALYRAADGTQDWNTFGSSDAGQLLARADFLAMQLGRQPDSTNTATSTLTPPWPASGVVGRVFYVNGEPALTGVRAVCESTSQAFNPYQVPCVNPVGGLSEVAVSPPSAQRSPTSPSGVVTGDWPYLQWTTSSGISTGTPTEQWTVQRLAPSNLATGSYAVASTSPARFGANLFVGNYDSGYDNLPAPETGSIVFGSFNGIEGAIGKYALPLDTSSWTTSGPATTHTGGGTVPKSFSFSFTTGGQTGPPAAAYLEAGYPPIPVLNVNVSPGYYTNIS